VVSADAVVVGAGIAGLTAALELAERGLRVTVLEEERVGAGAPAETPARSCSLLEEEDVAVTPMAGWGATTSAASTCA
jgi:gamma-glutamylputrescine oxidase